jgi:hypothetical protein
MRKHNKRMRRLAGRVMPLDLVRNRLRAPSLAATAADIEAVDRGEPTSARDQTAGEILRLIKAGDHLMMQVIRG